MVKLVGKNWWCSLFPALCFTDVSDGLVSDEAKELLDENLSNEEVDLLFGKTPKIKLKFKLLEFFNK